MLSDFKAHGQILRSGLVLSRRDLKHEKGPLSPPWDGGESREGFLEEVIPMPNLRGQEGASRMKGADARLGRGVPNGGDRMKAADTVSVFPSQMSPPGTPWWLS